MNTLTTGVTGLGLGILVIVILVGGGAMFKHIADLNAADAREAMVCQDLTIRVIPSGEAVTLVNQGDQTVSGTLTVERDGDTIDTTRTPPLPPSEPVAVPVPDADRITFHPDGCEKTFSTPIS